MKNIFDIENNFQKCATDSILKWGKKEFSKKQVSIAIPVYKNFEYFKKALTSAIKQTYKDSYSIVVIDNNHDDDINKINEYEEFIQSINNDSILYYKNVKNVGPVNNFNLGILKSNSEYVVMCHEDDELSEDCLEKLIAFKEKHNITNELVLTRNIYINLNSEITKKIIAFRQNYQKLRLWDFFLSSPSNGCGCLINRDAFINIGGYNPDYLPSADYALLSLYVYKYGGYRTNNEAYYRYRISDQNASNNEFYTCIERDEFFRNCMKEKFAIPNFILNRIIKANKACHTEKTELLWLHKTIHHASLFDKTIMRFVTKLNSISHHLFG